MARTPREPSAPDDAAAFFAASELGWSAFQRVQGLIDRLGPCELRVTRTQVGWARRRGFALLWMPGRWLTAPAAEVVLTITLDGGLDSPRWKEVVEVRPGLFTHHLELRSVDDIDDEVESWLSDAFSSAG